MHTDTLATTLKAVQSDVAESFHDWSVWGERMEGVTGRLNGTLAEVSLDVADMRERLLSAEAELLRTSSNPAAIQAVTGDVATMGTQLTAMEARLQELVDNVGNVDTALTSDVQPLVQSLRRNITELSSQLSHRMGSIETVGELKEGLEEIQKAIETLASKNSVTLLSGAINELSMTVSHQHIAATEQTKILNESLVTFEAATKAKLARSAARIDGFNTSLFDVLDYVDRKAAKTRELFMERLSTERQGVDQRLDSELTLVNSSLRDMSSTLDNFHIHLTALTPLHVAQDLRTQIVALEDTTRTFATIQMVTNATNEMAFKLERQWLDRLHSSHAIQVI